VSEVFDSSEQVKDSTQHLTKHNIRSGH